MYSKDIFVDSVWFYVLKSFYCYFVLQRFVSIFAIFHVSWIGETLGWEHFCTVLTSYYDPSHSSIYASMPYGSCWKESLIVFVLEDVLCIIWGRLHLWLEYTFPLTLIFLLLLLLMLSSSFADTSSVLCFFFHWNFFNIVNRSGGFCTRGSTVPKRCVMSASHEQLADTRHTKQTLVWVMLTTSITLADSYERYARLCLGIS